MFRIGQGIDIHNLTKKKTKQKLGGIQFELDYEIVAHSDGDIILHSISSALLGALSMNDLGTYFPDNDLKNKNKDSMEILNFVLNHIKQKNYNIENVDINVICEFIYFKEIKNKIVENLVKVLETRNISFKATRYEEKRKQIQCNTILILKKF